MSASRDILLRLFILLLVLCSVEGTVADTVFLKKGGRILNGVVVSETPASIEFKSGLGTIILSKGAIARIERSPADENKVMETQWQKDKEAEKEKVKEAKKIEDEQRAKGLVKYQGTWIPADKAYEMEKGFAQKQDEWQKMADQQKRDLEDMERRLRDMETRLDQRQREVDFREQQLAIKEQNLLLQQQNLQRQAEQVSREKQRISPLKLYTVPRLDVGPAPSTSD